ncbi:ArdC-like ssDNA-binding domain-containing protein [Sphingomonas sp. GB1N7]
MKNRTPRDRAGLYTEVTARVIAGLEAGRVPWVQPRNAAAGGCTMPHNALIGRRHSGINVLILGAAITNGRFRSRRWLTGWQAEAAGGTVRRGEKGIFRAASAASKAADLLPGFCPDAGDAIDREAGA